jgi:stearoyl-CoA desaturase (delta-9 desaturase)
MDLSEAPRLKYWNVGFLLTTLLIALIGTPWYLMTRGLGWPEGITFVTLWLLVGTSVTAGYHRLFSHRTYQAAWPVRLVFLIFGSGALENSVLNWASDHRLHHSNVDEERDPYNIQKGFWWAHMGWIFYEKPAPRSLVRDLYDDPLVVWQDRWYKLLGVGVAFGIPLVVGLATGRVLGCMLIGGILRLVVSHHSTFFINSLCHFIGGQPYSREHSARDSSVMALLAFGEGYHNYHHSFSFDYRNGIKFWHFDPAKWAIFTLSRVGLAKDLKRASSAAILKARVEVQFDRAKERLARVVSDARESCEPRLLEAHLKLQNVLRDVIAAGREASRRRESDGESSEAFHTRLQQSLNESLREWKLALRQMKRLPITSS